MPNETQIHTDMKKLKIYYHDGSIQICTPQTDPREPNKFSGDWKGLAETVAGKMYHGEHAFHHFEII